MRYFRTYLKEHTGAVLLSVLCALIFVVAFALYRLPVAAAIYPSALCAVILLSYAVYKCVRQKCKHSELKRLKKLPENLCDALKKYGGSPDCDYREIITALCKRESQMREDDTVRLSDMSDYYTTWVHQIKTPIAAMRLTLQGEDSAISRSLSDELFRIEQYVEMVLTFLRLDSDFSDYVFKEYSLDGIVKGCLRRFAGQFIGKGIELKYENISVSAVTDEKWLSFVIEQILSNALKYTPSGSISVYTESPLTLCIKDTGIGVAASDLPRIFDKGYTGYIGRADKKASGLGLYLCRRVCENLGHTISAESREGVGTVIKIDLSRNKTMFE